jgi:fumarate hydratase class II
MTVEHTPTELWGGETRKAVDNFPVSGERVPVAVVRWLGRIKGAAARANTSSRSTSSRPAPAPRRT